jgi:carbamoylphosphate synthase small subunit
VEIHGQGEKTVVLVDCGTKYNIIRCLTRRGVKVILVPWNYDFTTIPYDGLFISNGPGNPDFATETVENIRKAMAIGKPICGICMGNQLLAKAAGATTYKLSRCASKALTPATLPRRTTATPLTSQRSPAIGNRCSPT